MKNGTATDLVQAWCKGDHAALDQLMPKIHGEIYNIARGLLRREQKNHTISPTVLVNEVYPKIVSQNRMNLNDRNHFFSLCATLMRRILVDHAREKAAHKRGDGINNLTLDTGMRHCKKSPFAGLIDVIDLDKALFHFNRFLELSDKDIELPFNSFSFTIEGHKKLASQYVGQL